MNTNVVNRFHGADDYRSGTANAVSVAPPTEHGGSGGQSPHTRANDLGIGQNGSH